MTPRAPRRCSRPACDELLPCPTHTPAPWQSSHRRTLLPSDWHRIRAAILTRDPTCQLNLNGCTHTATEVDHIGRPDDHTPRNLRGVCTTCHRKRTATQSATARRPPPRRPR
jgi:5-methylcytosine-specific restriction enzyme A